MGSLWTVNTSTCSYNVVYSDEAREEITNYFNDKRAYVGTDGKFMASMSTANVELVLHNLTWPD